MAMERSANGARGLMSFDRDRRAEDRDREAAGREVEAHARDVVATRRSDAARERDQGVRDQLWTRQVSSEAAAHHATHPAGAGDSGSDAADLEQALIDREVAQAEVEWIRERLRDVLNDARRERDEAAGDRRASARDRAAGAVDRDAAAADRFASDADRGQAEIEANLVQGPGTAR